MLVISLFGSPHSWKSWNLSQPVCMNSQLEHRPDYILPGTKENSNSKEILRQQRDALNPTQQPLGDRNQESKGRFFLHWVIRWTNKSLLYVFKIAPINIASSLFRNEKPQEFFSFLVLHLSNHNRWLFWSSLQVVLTLLCASAQGVSDLMVVEYVF